MNTEQIITGKELIAEAGSPSSALVAFYKAFNQADLDLMSGNWLHTDEAIMSNPLGGIKYGWNEIILVYRQIFNGPAKVYVEFYDYKIQQTEFMFCAAGRERGYFRVADKEITLAIRTSRIYLKQQGQWRQVHHHGSMDNPALLAEYQSALLNR